MIFRRRPTTLGVRFALLLAFVLVVANVLALASMLLRGDDLDQTNRFALEAERMKSLISALEMAQSSAHPLLAAQFNTRFTRYSVDTFPLAEPAEPASPALQKAIERVIVRHWVHATEVSYQGEMIYLVSVELYAKWQGHPIWLNVVLNHGPRVSMSRTFELLWLPLMVSLLATLVVGLGFMRQMTRPLLGFVAAAEAAGNGDRRARIPEIGARELRTAAHAFNLMQEKIAGFEEERRRLVASVGHDLRTPITSLRFRAEMVEDAPLRNAMIETLEDMAVMADGLLAYGRGTQDTETRTPTDLRDLLSRLCDQMGATFRDETGREEAGTIANLRPTSIRRAFANLIGNALRYGTQAQVTLTTHDGTAQITVTDDGPGIAPALFAQVFEPFFRAETSRNMDTGGAGLGLSIAQAIFLQHDGTIRLANRPTGGLEVTVTLPLD
ncbi:MAG TPA: ATP-binding protein [Paenirhodobacter sp.]